MTNDTEYAIAHIGAEGDFRSFLAAFPLPNGGVSEWTSSKQNAETIINMTQGHYQMNGSHIELWEREVTEPQPSPGAIDGEIV